MKRNLLTLIIGAVLLLIFALLLFVFQVRQSEIAVVTTFGKLTRAVDQPGAHLKWPWPIQRDYKFDQRIQSFEDTLTENYTADYNTLLTSVYVGWRITNATAFFPKFPRSSAAASVAEAEKQLKDIVSHAKGAIVGNHPLSDFVNANERELKFDLIESEIQQAVQTRLRTNIWGVEIAFLGIKKLKLPESVSKSVFERMTAERQGLVIQAQNEGIAQAAKIKSSAEREAANTLTTAQGEAIRIQGEGEAAAANILPVFQQNPELAYFLAGMKALEQSLKERSTLIFDLRTPPFDLFGGLSTNQVNK